MTPAQWKEKPELLRRADLVQAGIKNQAIDDLRFEMKNPDESVPVGRIGAIRGLSGRRNRRKRNSKGYWVYVKWTVSRLLGGEYK